MDADSTESKSKFGSNVALSYLSRRSSSSRCTSEHRSFSSLHRSAFLWASPSASATFSINSSMRRWKFSAAISCLEVSCSNRSSAS